MADEDKKVEEAQEPTADQVELVGETKKAEAEAIEEFPRRVQLKLRVADAGRVERIRIEEDRQSIRDPA